MKFYLLIFELSKELNIYFLTDERRILPFIVFEYAESLEQLIRRFEDYIATSKEFNLVGPSDWLYKDSISFIKQTLEKYKIKYREEERNNIYKIFIRM